MMMMMMMMMIVAVILMFYPLSPYSCEYLGWRQKKPSPHIEGRCQYAENADVDS
jgi:hypothetical protein